MVIKSSQKIVSTDERKAFYAAEAAAAKPAIAETNNEGVLAGARDEAAAATNGDGSPDVAGGPLNEN
jgi:hypothetical protein